MSKEAVWLACKPKTCCYEAFVLVSGRDVGRIARALDASPSSFLVYFDSPEPDPDAFMLDGSGRLFQMALSKQPSKRRVTLPPCVFLVTTPHGGRRRRL